MKGSTFESFLDDVGIKEEVYNLAAKRVLAYEIGRLMEDKRISKTTMAARMATSRSQLDRLLDPANTSVQLDTIERAAGVLGKKIRIELVDVADTGTSI